MRGLERWLWAVGAVALAGCPSSSSPDAAVAAPARNLKVRVPPGWEVLPGPRGLSVGPKGRAVLQLESASRAMPTAEALAAAVETEGGVIGQKEQLDDFVSVVYRLPVADGGASEALLGVRRAGKDTVWCATTAALQSDEVQAARDVCAGVK